MAKAELLLWDEIAYNSVLELEPGNATQTVEMKWNATVGRYEYVYEGVAAKQMFDIIYSCMMFTTTDGEVIYGGVMPFCAERYVCNNYKKTGADNNYLGEVVQALAVYGDAARTYFGTN